MSDEPAEKKGLVARLRRWVKGAIVDQTPAEMEVCEFHCRKLECTLGKWDTCENRLGRTDSGGR